jgi:hypothetical protein
MHNRIILQQKLETYLIKFGKQKKIPSLPVN